MGLLNIFSTSDPFHPRNAEIHVFVLLGDEENTGYGTCTEVRDTLQDAFHHVGFWD